MKTVAAFSTLIASTLAQGYFGVMSARSASPVHLLPLNAIGGKFFLGGSPSSYCPPQVGDVCNEYPGNSTVLAGGDGTLSLAVIVPGGQRVYIAPDATMSYTVPHSAYIPEGSVVDGWSKTEGESFGHLTFDGGLVACPVEGKPWQVYGQRPNVTLSPECLGFSALTVNSTTAGAWEY
ncbi:hypothetical protein BU26DRAFT_191417 [Trematosphaeria pertusa]|uniref:IgE-binding protein n=1 Tax=Trematosphaeria pertusa TaxID=390896 RepID=A0A6A6HRP4_9PLEO|nr:uncharacterized protein BU26DRAFT_191417 [Trematosphaeria pertusa]KAF2240825.1 hypothetical protein BU26DRAFT_191417 [Trematosphaeria pertusa]